MKRLRLFALAFLGVSLVTAVLVVIGLIRLDRELSDRFETRTFLAPTTYWALPEAFASQSVWMEADVQRLFASRQYSLASNLEEIRPGQYMSGPCPEIPFGPESSARTCFFFRAHDNLHPQIQELRLQAFSLQPEQGAQQGRSDQGNIIDKIFVQKKGQDQWEAAAEARLNPRRVAQFVGGHPLLQEYTPLGEIPPSCPNAVLAIEDPRFFEHSGINWRGLARAFVVNLSSARFAQGGSTITQQMVKNFFLNAEKTVSRKLKELGMALLLESRLGKMGKDRIFETYLNIIYLGQSGPFQIRGYAAASRHYFQKPLQDLNVPECALLAAVLNSPGLYDPFKSHERALKRRNLVLSKMKDADFITATEYELGVNAQMPSHHRPGIEESAPYFIEAVQRELSNLGIEQEGLHVFSTMNLEVQEVAQKSLVRHLVALEQKHEALKKLRAQGHRLEGIAVTVEVGTGRILAAIGGRGFRSSPFNRILDGRRQVGSLAKPFVFLSALEQDANLGPFTLVPDQLTTYKIYRNEWTPENYGKKFFGDVALGFALKNSLNAATAALGMKVGVPSIVATLRKAGVLSKIDEVPSLTLGAMDLKPIEMVEAYLSLARMGDHLRPRFFEALVGENGKSITLEEEKHQQVFDPQATAVLIGMMKQTLKTGTAAFIGRSGFAWPAAGKTGTTSDYRDAWFIGFTPWDLTMVWVGYDQNQSHGLTGGSGAAPVWLPIMNLASKNRLSSDFTLPDGVRTSAGELLPDPEPSEVFTR